VCCFSRAPLAAIAVCYARCRANANHGRPGNAKQAAEDLSRQPKTGDTNQAARKPDLGTLGADCVGTLSDRRRHSIVNPEQSIISSLDSILNSWMLTLG